MPLHKKTRFKLCAMYGFMLGVQGLGSHVIRPLDPELKLGNLVLKVFCNKDKSQGKFSHLIGQVYNYLFVFIWSSKVNKWGPLCMLIDNLQKGLLLRIFTFRKSYLEVLEIQESQQVSCYFVSFYYFELQSLFKGSLCVVGLALVILSLYGSSCDTLLLYLSLFLLNPNNFFFSLSSSTLGTFFL